MLRDLEKVDVINKQPEFFGGGPVMKYALNGNSGSYPEVGMLAEFTAMGGQMGCGGRQNKVRKEGVAKALRTYGRAVKSLGKNVKPIKQALTQKVVETISGAPQQSAPMAYAEEVPFFPEVPMKAGRQNKVRKEGFAKALRTYGRAVAPLGKNLKPVKQALTSKAVETIQSVNPMMMAGKKAKRPASARAAIVKKVMAEKGMGMIEASKYVKANGLY